MIVNYNKPYYIVKRNDEVIGTLQDNYDEYVNLAFNLRPSDKLELERKNDTDTVSLSTFDKEDSKDKPRYINFQSYLRKKRDELMKYEGTRVRYTFKFKDILHKYRYYYSEYDKPKDILNLNPVDVFLMNRGDLKDVPIESIVVELYTDYNKTITSMMYHNNGNTPLNTELINEPSYKEFIEELRAKYMANTFDKKYRVFIKLPTRYSEDKNQWIDLDKLNEQRNKLLAETNGHKDKYESLFTDWFVDYVWDDDSVGHIDHFNFDYIVEDNYGNIALKKKLSFELIYTGDSTFDYRSAINKVINTANFYRKHCLPKMIK